MIVKEIDSIVITLSSGIIKDRPGGLKQIIKEWKRCSHTEFENMNWWMYFVRGKPAKDFLFVYWVIGGKVAYSCRCLKVHDNEKEEVDYRRGTLHLQKRYGLILYNFEYIPRSYHVQMKGFQGFRYANSLDMVDAQFIK